MYVLGTSVLLWCVVECRLKLWTEHCGRDVMETFVFVANTDVEFSASLKCLNIVFSTNSCVNIMLVNVILKICNRINNIAHVYCMMLGFISSAQSGKANEFDGSVLNVKTTTWCLCLCRQMCLHKCVCNLYMCRMLYCLARRSTLMYSFTRRSAKSQQISANTNTCTIETTCELNRSQYVDSLDIVLQL